jgi:uncharacterized phage protein (TIGR02218 family)
MSKTISIALKAHHAQETTTLAWCWKVTRRDQQVFGFTSVDKDLEIDGVTYEAAAGITPSAIENRLDGSVPNLELASLLDSDRITEADLLAGKWDGATAQIFEVNYADLTQGSMLLHVGMLGQVVVGASSFRAELRGLAQRLQQSVGRVFAAACDANLGDARCKVDLAPLTVTGTVDLLNSRRIFGDTGRSEVEDWFGAGVVTWLTGANADLSMEIAQFHVGGGFVLQLPMPNDIAIGDTYSMVPGCRKRRTEDCGVKFNNVVNHRGFPDVPGNDKVLGNATASDAG